MTRLSVKQVENSETVARHNLGQLRGYECSKDKLERDLRNKQLAYQWGYLKTAFTRGLMEYYRISDNEAINLMEIITLDSIFNIPVEKAKEG